MNSNELQQIFIENLKNARKKANLSQMKLADLTEFSVGFIGDLESGRRWCTLETLAKLADVLNVKPYKLLEPPQDSFQNIDENFKSVQKEYFKMLNSVLNKNLGKAVESAISDTLESLSEV